MTTDSDERIRQLFRRIREIDEGSVPPFSTVLEDVRPSRSRPRWVAYALVTILLLFAVSVWSYWSFFPGANPAKVALSEWKSPTDFLLRSPAEVLWTRVPEFSSGDSLWIGRVRVEETVR